MNIEGLYGRYIRKTINKIFNRYSYVNDLICDFFSRKETDPKYEIRIRNNNKTGVYIDTEWQWFRYY